MRATTTISFPNEKILHNAKRIAIKKGFKNFSSYLTKLINIDQIEENIITEDDVLDLEKKFMQDHKQGQTKILNSLSDLIKN